MWMGVQLTVVGLRVGKVGRREYGKSRPRVFWKEERSGFGDA